MEASATMQYAADCAAKLNIQCARGVLEMQTLPVLNEVANSPCKDAIDSHCKTSIDKLKEAVEDVDIPKVLAGVVDVVECLAKNAKDIANKCSPFERQGCQDELANVCPQFVAPSSVVEAASTMPSATACAAMMTDKCAKQLLVVQTRSMVEHSDKPCKDAIHSHCGKAIDELNKAIQDTSIMRILKGAVDVAQCITSNAEDIAKKCNPIHQVVEEEEENDNTCGLRVEAFCPVLDDNMDNIDTLSQAVDCVVDKRSVLGDECVVRALQPVLDAFEATQSDSPCHSELRKDCGKQIDAFKKAMQDTEVIDSIKGAVDVVSCVAHNAEDLVNHCFKKQADAEKLTKAPTKKLTAKPSKPVTKKPTKKPSNPPHAVAAVFQLVAPLPMPGASASSRAPEEMVDAPQVNALPYAMGPMGPMNMDHRHGDHHGDRHGDRHGDHHGDHHPWSMFGYGEGLRGKPMVSYEAQVVMMKDCVKVAHRVCGPEIALVKASPNVDAEAFGALETCLEEHMPEIEAECVVSTQGVSSTYWAEPALFDQADDDMHAMRHRYRHRHMCRRGLLAGLVLALLALGFAKAGRRVCRRKSQQPEEVVEVYVAVPAEEPLLREEKHVVGQMV